MEPLKRIEIPSGTRPGSPTVDQTMAVANIRAVITNSPVYANAPSPFVNHQLSPAPELLLTAQLALL
jgi:hypothetical protein